MQTKLRDLLVKLRVDSVQVDRELQRTARSLDRFAQKTADVGQRLSIGLTVPLLAAAGYSSELASSTEELGAKFDAVFKGMAGQVEEFAESQAEALNLSRHEYKEWLSRLQDTFVPLGFARERASELSMAVSTLAVDVGTFNDMATPEVVDRFTSALVGNHEAVREFGIVITQATLKQELLRMGIMGGVQAATEQEKVQARLNLIFQQSADAQGNAAREAEGFASKKKGLSAAARDLSTRYGDELNPALQELVENLTSAARKAEGASGEQIRLNIAIGGTLALMGPATLAVAGLAGAVAKLATALSVGVLPLIGLGGAVIVGLGLLSTGLIKTKLDAAAARKELDDVARSAGQLEEDTKEGARNALANIAQTIDNLRERGVLNAERLRVLLDRAAEINAMFGDLADPETTPPVNEDLTKVMDGMATKLAVVAGEAELFGDSQTYAEERVKILRNTLRDLLELGLAPTSSVIQSVVGDLGDAERAVTAWQGAVDPPLIAQLGLQLGKLPPILAWTSQEAVRVGNTLLDVKDVTDQIRDVGVRAFASFGDAVVESSLRGAEAFRRFAASVIRDLARIAARFFIFKALGSFLPGDSAFLDSVGKSFGFRAFGGSVAPGRSYIVGERGPEMFVPHSAGQIRTNAQMGGGPAVVLDASRMPAPKDPRQAARDRDWLEFLSHSFSEARLAGVKI